MRNKQTAWDGDGGFGMIASVFDSVFCTFLRGFVHRCSKIWDLGGPNMGGFLLWLFCFVLVLFVLVYWWLVVFVSWADCLLKNLFICCVCFTSAHPTTVEYCHCISLSPATSLLML